jgi:hypothetical protein
LDGRHLSGLEIEFYSEASGLVKKVPVDWQIIYTRYSAHQAFTKGVLLVDRSGGSARQVLEITSEECKWRARKQGGKWTAVKNEETISVPDGKDYLAGFHVSRKVAPNGHKHVHLNLNTKGGKADKAFLSLSGRPHHNINLQFVMKQRRGFDSVCYRIPGCTRRTA